MTDPTTPQPHGPRADEPQPPRPDESQPHHDWLLSDHVVPPPAAGDADPAYLAPETDAPPARGWRSVSRAQKIVAVVAAGVIGAGGVAVAAHASSGASGTGTTTNAAGQVPGGTQLQSGGQAPGGGQGFGGPGGGPGRVDGEQHVEGTVTSTTSSTVTVKATDGTRGTYSVTSDTQVVRDGALASLSDVKVGDAVLVHVLPTTSGGHKVAERVFAGTLPTGGFGPGGPGDTNGGGGGDSTGTGGASTT